MTLKSEWLFIWLSILTPARNKRQNASFPPYHVLFSRLGCFVLFIYIYILYMIQVIFFFFCREHSAGSTRPFLSRSRPECLLCILIHYCLLIKTYFWQARNAAKAEKAAQLANERQMRRKRAERAKRRRIATTAAKKAAQDRETAAKARKKLCINTLCNRWITTTTYSTTVCSIYFIITRRPRGLLIVQ